MGRLVSRRMAPLEREHRAVSFYPGGGDNCGTYIHAERKTFSRTGYVGGLTTCRLVYHRSVVVVFARVHVVGANLVIARQDCSAKSKHDKGLDVSL